MTALFAAAEQEAAEWEMQGEQDKAARWRTDIAAARREQQRLKAAREAKHWDSWRAARGLPPRRVAASSTAPAASSSSSSAVLQQATLTQHGFLAEAEQAADPTRPAHVKKWPNFVQRGDVKQRLAELVQQRLNPLDVVFYAVVWLSDNQVGRPISFPELQHHLPSDYTYETIWTALENWDHLEVLRGLRTCGYTCLRMQYDEAAIHRDALAAGVIDEKAPWRIIR